MALSIKDPEADRLARDIAALRGTTMTQAIVDALRHEWTRIAPVGTGLTPEQAAMVADIMAIAKRSAALPVLDDRSDDELLDYDPETGLWPEKS